MPQHRLTRYLILTAALALAPSLADAQGFGVNEIGTCAASRGFAVTGSPCKDASVVFWNPAAIGTLTGWNVLGGAAILQITGSFKEDTTFRKFDGDVPTLVVPHFFVTYKPKAGPLAYNGKMSYGFGVYVPYGLTSQWGDDFPGRFTAKKASLETIYFQPTAAYQVNDKWSVGFGPVIGYSNVELDQSLDLGELQTTTPGVFFKQLGIPRHTEFGKVSLEGSATGFGAQLGLFGKPTENMTFGIRFLTPIEFKYDGASADFTQTQTGIILPPRNAICYPPTRPGFCSDSLDTVNMDTDILNGVFAAVLVDQAVETEVTHPGQIQFGFGYTGFTNWVLSADYTWTGWRRFRELPIRFLGTANISNRNLIEDYNNTSSIRLGAERSFTNGAQLRAGFSGIASAAPDETVTPLLPEQDRAYYTIGGAYPFMSHFTIEGAFVKATTGGKRGRVDERPSRSSTAAQINTGRYSFGANIFSVSLKVNY